MSKRGMPGLVSGDSALSIGHKRKKQELLPSRHAKAQLTGGDLTQRTMGNYAKMAPSLTGVGNAGGLMPQ